MSKHGNDAIIDKNSEEIIFIFGDYRENDLAKWIRKQNRDRLILSRETLYAMKNVGFPFVKSSNERYDESYAALVAYKEKQGNLLIRNRTNSSEGRQEFASSIQGSSERGEV